MINDMVVVSGAPGIDNNPVRVFLVDKTEAFADYIVRINQSENYDIGGVNFLLFYKAGVSPGKPPPAPQPVASVFLSYNHILTIHQPASLSIW